MKLMEIIHSLDKENKDRLVNIDDWRWPDVDHLVTMGFEFGDDHHLNTTKEPHISVYKKKDKDEQTQKVMEFFYVEEKDRVTKRFRAFNELIDYFDTYSQPEIDKNLK